MATKQSVIYSTNPKMDTSGIFAKAPTYAVDGKQAGTKVVTGGMLYQEAIKGQAETYGMQKANALTNKKNLRAAAKLVDAGYSADSAFDIVGKKAKGAGSRG